MPKLYAIALATLMFIAPTHNKANSCVVPTFIAAAAAMYGHEAYKNWCFYNQAKKEKITIDEPQLPDTAPVITIFVHGLGGSRNCGNYYKKQGCIQTPLHTFDFPDSRLGQAKKANLAQDIDIACLRTEYEKMVAQGYRVILHGVSRGAATIITFMGTHTTKNVVAIICDSPFDAITTPANTVLRRYQAHWIPGLAALALAWRHPSHSMYGVRPIDVVHKIQNEVPVLLIASMEDDLVPYTCSQNLVQQLINIRPSHSWLLITREGKHGNIIGGAQGHDYRTAVHKFLQLHGLPHNAEHARHCIADFNHTLLGESCCLIRQYNLQRAW